MFISVQTVSDFRSSWSLSLIFFKEEGEEEAVSGRKRGRRGNNFTDSPSSRQQLRQKDRQEELVQDKGRPLMHEERGQKISECSFLSKEEEMPETQVGILRQDKLCCGVTSSSTHPSSFPAKQQQQPKRRRKRKLL